MPARRDTQLDLIRRYAKTLRGGSSPAGRARSFDPVRQRRAASPLVDAARNLTADALRLRRRPPASPTL
jgi:hypothetical protein